MAKASTGGRSGIGLKIEGGSVKKKTSIGRNNSMIGLSSMNKSKRNSYKKYRGQGK